MWVFRDFSCLCSEHFEPEKEAATDKKDKKSTKTTPKGDEDKKTEADKKAEKEKAEKAAESSPDMSSQQAVAVIGLALIAMGEDIGSEMLFRWFFLSLMFMQARLWISKLGGDISIG